MYCLKLKNSIPFTIKQRVGELGRNSSRKPAVKLREAQVFRQGPSQFFSSCVVKQLYAFAYERIERITHNAEIALKK
jgi:hypothetical protein